jgi:SAM-dependent methyltransferase
VATTTTIIAISLWGDALSNPAIPGPGPSHWHESYERGRPGYPPEAVSLAELPPTATVVELGAGTGKLTRLLVSEFERVIAVEPDEGMRRLLVQICPVAEVLAGSAEDIPVADSSADAVFSAEAFHWFDGERALAEIARVLRPRGALLLLWNLPAGPTTPSIGAVEQLLEEFGPDRAGLGYDPNDLNPTRFATDQWRAPFIDSPFEALREVQLPNPQTVSPDELVAFFGSMGWIADLPDAERLPLLREVRSLLTSSAYTRSWETRIYRTRIASPRR